MNYIIVDPEDKSSSELKNILDSYKILGIHGKVKTFEAVTDSIQKEKPDLAFIRMKNIHLNVYKLISEIKEKSPFSKVIFMSDHELDAVEAFEYDADGFLLIPFDEKQIRHMMMSSLDKHEAGENISKT
jgi:two-component SAPR family response regulator